MFLGLMLAFVGETLLGIVTERVSTKVTDAALSAIRGRLSNGRLELPKNHDLERAHRVSARFAFHYLIAQVLPSIEDVPSRARTLFSRTIFAKPPATAGYGKAEAGSVLAWCRELETLLQDDAWIDSWSAEALDAESLETVASAQIDDDLLTAFHASVVRVLAASSLPEMPVIMADAIGDGWSVTDPETDRTSIVTLYGAYCLRFQDLIAHDTVLARKVEMNSREVIADRFAELPTAPSAVDSEAIAAAVRAEVGPASELLSYHLVDIEQAVDRVGEQLDELTELVAQVDATTKQTLDHVVEIHSSVVESAVILSELGRWVSESSAVARPQATAVDVDALLADYAVHLRGTTARLSRGGGGIADGLSVTELGIASMPIQRRGNHKTPSLSEASQLAGAESVVLIGGPGAGKSTILQWLVHREVVERAAVPILITCRTLRDGVFDARRDELLPALVEHALGSWSELTDVELSAIRQRLVDDVRDGTALLAVDGLDEISDGTKRAQFAVDLADVLTAATRIVVATRDTGAEGAVPALAEKLEKLGGGGLSAPASRRYDIAPLGSAAQLGLIDAWTSARAEDRQAYARLRAAIEAGAEPARLGSTVFLLSLLLQEVEADERLPVRRRDLFRRIVERGVGHQRPVDPPLTADEVFPRLEHVALAMVRDGKVDIAETELIGLLREFETAQLDDFPSVAARRSPSDFLDAALSSGLLVDAGQGPRRRGIPQRIIAFFHQSFQEYFAGRGIVHRWLEVGTALEDVCGVIDEAVAQGELAPRWVETLRHAIDAAEAESLDGRWFGVTPAVGVQDLVALFVTPDDESRPLSVLTVGLWGLATAGELTLEPETAYGVLASAIRALETSRLPAAWGDALGDLVRSPWRDAVLAAYRAAGSRAAREWGAGIIEHLLPPGFALDDLPALMTARTYRAWDEASVTESSVAIMEIVELAFRAQGPLGGEERIGDELQPTGMRGLTGAHKAEFWDDLIRLDDGERDQRLITWALLWVACAKNPVGDVEGLEMRHREWVLNRLAALAAAPAADSWVVADMALLAALPWDGSSAYAQRDWVYDWAVTADGGWPHRAMPGLVGGADEPLASFLTGLVLTAPPWTARWIAIAAARVGSRDSALIEPLAQMLTDDREWVGVRDEAWYSLLGIRDDRVTEFLLAAIPRSDDDYLQTRGVLGTIARGRVEDLERLAQPGPNYDDAYVQALMGLDDPRGAEIASEIARSHPDETHRARVAAAVERTAAWDEG